MLHPRTRTGGTGVLILLVLCVSGTMLAQQAPAVTFSVDTTIRSTVAIEKLLDQMVVELVAERNYREGADPAFTWTSPALRRVEAARYLTVPVNGGTRTVEVYAVRDPLGLFVIRGDGHEYRDGRRTQNEDVSRAEKSIRSWSQRIVSAPNAERSTGRDLGTRSMQLSYIQTDRALAILKALGYAVIEFSAQRGESVYDTLFTPTASLRELPVIVKMVDAAKTSLMDPKPETGGVPQQVMPGMPQTRQPIPDIGGTFLHNITTSDPSQRLLVVYDRAAPEALERLLNVIATEIDVPARQVVISALVVEVNTERLRDLGLTFNGSDGRSTVSFGRGDGPRKPFTFTFDEGALRGDFNFAATITALVERGEAEILSNPSVLVVDGRQARIQVGKQVPVVSSTSTAAGITSSVEYFPVGIVLNIRPRISVGGEEVSMQVETIVSAVAQTSVAVSQVFFAPTIDNRQVQTFVRVADNTPFIIGGLISSDRESVRSGVPLLSDIPFIGALFRRNFTSRGKREVIVVLTPHVVPLDDRTFSYVVPQDAERFDSSGHELFRDSYRIRRGDVYDLSFIYASDAYKALVRSGRTGVTGADHAAPGEEIFVRRMLWEVARRNALGKGIDPSQMLFFRSARGGDPGGEVAFLDKYLAQLDAKNNALVLTFAANQSGDGDHPFVQPQAEVTFEHIEPGEYEHRLRALNRGDSSGRPAQWAIVLSDADPSSTKSIDALRAALVMKQMLALNSSLPLRVKELYVGRQIIVPSPDDLDRNVQVIDPMLAKFFYEAKDYYSAFEQEFNARLRSPAATRP